MITLKLTIDDAVRLRAALDAYSYFEISDEDERNNGFVYYPEPDEREGASPDDIERWEELDAIEALDAAIHDELRKHKETCGSVSDSGYCETNNKESDHGRGT